MEDIPKPVAQSPIPNIAAMPEAVAVEGLPNQSGDDDQPEMGGDQGAPLPPNPHNIPDEPSTVTLEEAQSFYDRYDIPQDIEVHVPSENELLCLSGGLPWGPRSRF